MIVFKCKNVQRVRHEAGGATTESEDDSDMEWYGKMRGIGGGVTAVLVPLLPLLGFLCK